MTALFTLSDGLELHSGVVRGWQGWHMPWAPSQGGRRKGRKKKKKQNFSEKLHP